MRPVKFDRRAALLAALALSVFVLTVAVTVHVPLLGDDYFYATIAARSGRAFWQEHLTHYEIINGRVIVHLLVTLFLKMPPLVWQITNACLLAAAVALAFAHLTEKGKHARNLIACALGVVFVLSLDPDMTAQSVYWLTGSFNYVYPLTLLFAFWLLLAGRESRARTVFLPVLAFFAAATTEQNGMMTLGVAVLYLLDKRLLKKEKSKPVELLAAALALIGVLTVLLSPATSVRYGIEAEAGVLETIADSLPTIFYFFVAHRYTVCFVLFALGSIAVFLACASRGAKHPVLLRLLAVGQLCAAATVLHLYATLSPVFTPRIIAEMTAVAILSAAGTVTSLAILCKGRARGYLFPVTAIILAVGSQVMMSVSPVFGARTMLCGVVCLFLFSASLLLYAWDSARPVARVAVLTVCVLMLSAAVPVYAHTVRGYAANDATDRENREAIVAYLAGESDALILKKNTAYDCDWSMPYESPYHLGYYKLYYGIPADCEIVWIDG